MVEYPMLILVGKIVKSFVIGGYSLAGFLVAKTGYTYVRDYIEYSKLERGN